MGAVMALVKLTVPTAQTVMSPVACAVELATIRELPVRDVLAPANSIAANVTV